MAPRPLPVGRVDRAGGLAVPRRPKRVEHPLIKPSVQHLMAGAVPVRRGRFQTLGIIRGKIRS